MVVSLQDIRHLRAFLRSLGRICTYKKPSEMRLLWASKVLFQLPQYLVGFLGHHSYGDTLFALVFLLHLIKTQTPLGFPNRFTPHLCPQKHGVRVYSFSASPRSPSFLRTEEAEDAPSRSPNHFTSLLSLHPCFLTSLPSTQLSPLPPPEVQMSFFKSTTRSTYRTAF